MSGQDGRGTEVLPWSTWFLFIFLALPLLYGYIIVHMVYGRQHRKRGLPNSSRLYSLQELALFNGARADEPIYVAIKGKVYDVSSSCNYGPDETYHQFAGRDISRALATVSLSLPANSMRLDDLTQKHMNVLDDWILNFQAKYPVVGKLDSIAHYGPDYVPTPNPTSSTGEQAW